MCMSEAYFRGQAFLDSCLSSNLHIYYSAHDRPATGVLDALADSKVGDFDFASGVEENIFGLNIPVDGVALCVYIL